MKKLRCRHHQWVKHNDEAEKSSWRLCEMCGLLQGKKMNSGKRWQTVKYEKPEGQAPMPGKHGFSVGKERPGQFGG